MNGHAPARARVLRAATIAAGAASLTFALARLPLDATSTLCLLLAGVLLAELLEISGKGGAQMEEPRFSFSSAVHLAAVLLLGIWAAVLVAAFGVLVVDRLKSSPWGRVAFNASVFALAALAAGAAFTIAGGNPGTLELPAHFLPIAAASIAYGVVNAVLVTLMIVFWSRSPLRGAFPRSIGSTLASSTAEAALGVLLALCALVEPWAIAAVVPLVLAAYLAHARHVQLRLETARALATFAAVIDERDRGTFRHSARVAELVGELARGLRLPAAEVARLESAGRLHDLGKISVDAAVLRKAGRLSGEEWAAMRRHPRLSARLLQQFEFAAGEAHAVEHHHERYDGRGYYGVPREEIPLAAHFLTVADTFDAMCSDRPYRPGLSEAEALAEIQRNAGRQFHPAVAKAFVAQRRGQDPVESLEPEEYLELRAVAVRGPRKSRSKSDAVVLLPVPLLAVGLAGAGMAHEAAIVAGVVLGAGALFVQRVQEGRVRRLAEELEAAAARAPTQAFDAVVATLNAESPLVWGALHAWDERELTGSIVMASGDAACAPTQTALTSWLIREAEAGAGVLDEGSTLAVPMVEESGSTIGHILLVFDGAAPARVRRALALAHPALSKALAGFLEHGPARQMAVVG